MTTTRVYLDKRAAKRGQAAPLKIAINKNGDTAFIPLNIKIHPSQWDSKRQRIIDNPNKTKLNSYVEMQKVKVDNIIRDLTEKELLAGLTATQIKNKVLDVLNPSNKNLFTSRFEEYIRTCRADSTKEKYVLTLKRIRSYDTHADERDFCDITKEWLRGFDLYLQQFSPSQNARNILLRCVRAVFNDAIDNNITSCYPFRKFKITPQPTRKRSLSVEKLRELMNYPVEPYQERYRDAFMLTFYLIGINTVDLLENAKVVGGRLNYIRAKTGKFYSIKIEPEAQTLLDKYKGKDWLVSFRDGYANYHTFVGKCDKGLKEIGSIELIPNKDYIKESRRLPYHRKHVAAFPDLSLYWARHTWSTIAYKIGIPEQIISDALGHTHGCATTNIYISKSLDAVDEANRRVLDYVLYNKV